ncbi:uncharacterized protein LOC119593642 [Penaeus monodon]|uniref:uncharacterized protein LOC119593642 n=1 Tax=Penaeus monodon TaxID=6687 RepID=UPI0018A713C4|nr:uncharacterized protein LOC119593642 [Penaeus monodon]
MILKTTDSHGKIVGCTFSQRLQSAQSQRSQLARWWRRTRGAVERPASVAGFLDVAERCLETEVPAPKTSWTFRTLLKVIAPGTMWCGHGTLARDLTQLGSRSGTDRCCQIHDLCPVQLVPFVAYRGVMTAGPKTLSHCDCDRRFADCLRKVNSMGSRGVFHAYFNLAFRGNMCVTDDYLARGRSLSWASRSLLSGVGRVLRMLMRVAETDEGEGELQEVELQEVELQEVEQQEVEQQEVEQQEVEQQEVKQQEVEQQEVEQQEEVEQQKMELRVKVQQEEEQKEEVKERQPEVEQKVKVKQQAEQQRGTEGASAATGTVNDSVTAAPGENLVNATTEESMVATTPATNEESMVATTPDENSSTTTTTTDQALTTTEENLVTTSPDGNLVSTTPSEVFIYTPPGEEFILIPEYNLVSTGLGAGGFVLTEPEEGSPVPIQPEGSIGPLFS